MCPVEKDCFQTPAGWVTIAFSQDRLLRLQFRKSSIAFRQRVSSYRSTVLSWFEGRSHPALTLDVSWATPFGQKVYQAVRRIPRGSVLTYGEVAAQIGSPRSARAVGGAMRRNQIGLFIP